MSDSIISAFSSLSSRQLHHRSLLFNHHPSFSATIKISPSILLRLKKTIISAVNLNSKIKNHSLTEDIPLSIDLIPVTSDEQFDRILTEAQQLEESIIVLWMANWCRKCIYLKPKLEKLAADYYPRIRFFCVDVNTVPQKLVNRAGITLWRDSQKQAEVIGGHKAWLVVDDVRRMIENED